MKRSFPPPAIVSKEGKPLLSWRVAILPLLEDPKATELHAKFHLDEPWDSEHNKSLLVEMPDIYRDPADTKKESTNTSVVLPISDRGIFSANKGHRMQEISDGTSGTILMIETKTEIPWTKPEDLVVSEDLTPARLSQVYKYGFVYAFADGSVHLMPSTADAKKFHTLITRDGGETPEFVDP